LEFVSGIPEVCVVVAEGLPLAVPGERLAMTAAALEARAKEQRAEAKAAGEDVSNFVIPDYSGPVAVLTTRLEELAAAYASIDERQAPMRLDMSNRFALALWLRDGTRIDLDNSTHLKNKYASAMQAIARYLERHPEYDGQGEIRVDVSDLSSVLVSYKTIN
jgi:hypothetical protein